MSDFTKEELEFLYEAARHIGKQGIELNSDIHPYFLKDKIQSLIDNYCEHGNMWAHQSKCPDCGASDEIPGLI